MMIRQPSYIDPEELAKLVLSTPGTIAIIDVREHDYTFGKIRGSYHLPFYLLQSSIPKIKELSLGKKKVIFHCHYSQTRGPSAASIFLNSFEGSSSPTPTPTPNPNPNPYSSSSSITTPEVLILQGGFKQWRSLYQNDPNLYETI